MDMRKNKNMDRISSGNIAIIDKIGYGCGNMSFGIVLQIISAYLLFFATAVLNIPASLVGTAISISVIWDGITDPTMGYISDKTQTKRYGRRHLYLLIGTVGTALSNYMLWTISNQMSLNLKFGLLFTWLMLAKTFMTIYATPYTALGAELSSDYNERTSIQGFKTVFFILGLTFSSVAMYLFFNPTEEYPTGQLNPNAYKKMAIVSSLIVIVFGMACYLATKKYIPLLPKYQKQDNDNVSKVTSLFKGFLKILKIKDYRMVVLGYLFTNISSALLSNIGIHVFTYTFKLDNKVIAYIFGLLFLTSILSQPLWMYISKKTDKKPSVMIGLSCSIAGGVIFLIMLAFKASIAGNFTYFIPFSVLSGFGIGGLFSLPLSMIADTIDLEELNTGERSEGTFYGCLTLFYKLSQSISIFLLGLILDVLEFDSENPVQPESTVITLGLVLAFGCIMSFIVALICYSRYSLDRETVINIQKQNKERKNLSKDESRNIETENGINNLSDEKYSYDNKSATPSV